MTQSAKAAWVAFALITALTVVKFLLYRFSGSMAVLSEAWHSLADISTTLLVLLSILRQQKKEQRIEPAGHPSLTGGAGDPSESKSNRLEIFKRWYALIRSINTELKVAFAIGTILLSAAVTIAWRAIASQPGQVASPLLTGSIFIGLSFGSFFLYRFEENVGSSEKSAALIADSHHNRADMAISLLTGLSLILYHFGFDLDRWVCILIALYIISFASELLVNAIRSMYHNLQNVDMTYRFSSIVSLVFQPRTYYSLFKVIDSHFKVGQGARSVLKTIPAIGSWMIRWAVRLGGAAALAWYVSTGLYIVSPGEQALLFRFGRLINQDTPVSSGLHVKLPYPIDTTVRYQVERVQALSVGNMSGDEAAMIWTREHGDNRTFISGDNNLFLPYLVIHYRIRDIHAYHLAHRKEGPEQTLAASAYRELNRIFSQTTFYELILDKREEWIRSVEQSLQAEIDRFETGLEIVAFCLKDMHPPVDLSGAFEDVVAAGQLRETYLNNARRKVNSLLSRERIQALETVSDAESYVTEKKKIAEGESANYLLRFAGYQAGGEIMKDLLLLQSAQKTLQGKQLFLVDPNSGIDSTLLYIENFISAKDKK